MTLFFLGPTSVPKKKRSGGRGGGGGQELGL